MRELIKNSYPYSSSRKQSEWMHIPLGRILVPLGSKTFRELKEYVFNLNNFMYDLKISMIHLIHEYRWYMTEKKYLYSSKLSHGEFYVLFRLEWNLQDQAKLQKLGQSLLFYVVKAAQSSINK